MNDVNKTKLFREDSWDLNNEPQKYTTLID